MPHAASNNQAIPVRTSLKPLSEDSAVSTQDSDYGSLSQSFEFDDHTQDTGDKCGKRTSPTCSSSPSENFKSKRTRDGFDKDDSSQMKVGLAVLLINTHSLPVHCTVPLRRNPTGNVFANWYRTDTEQV